MARGRWLKVGHCGLAMLGALVFGGACLAQGLPVFEGAEYDKLVIDAPTQTVSRNRARIKAGGARPVIRFTSPTIVRQAARGVGQVRVKVETRGAPLVVACTGFHVAKHLILTAYRCGPGLLSEPAVAAGNPTGITGIDFITGYDVPRQDGQGVRMRVAIKPVEADLALGYAVLRTDGTPGTALVLSPEAPARSGVPLTIVLHPFGESLHVLRNGCASRGGATASGRLSHGCAVMAGSAGAPVLDAQGHVIALQLEEDAQRAGGSAVTMARLLARSPLLQALADGQSCEGGAAALCGLAQSVDKPGALALQDDAPMRPLPTPLAPDPMAAASGAVAEPRDAEIAEPVAGSEHDPTQAFPVGLIDGRPAVHGISLPYLPPGTGIELLTGPVGAIDSRGALLAAGAVGYAATVTSLGDRHAALSLWRVPEGSLVARRFIAPGAEAVALRPDGKRLALARPTKDTSVWAIEFFDLPALDTLATLRLTAEVPVSSLRFSPDGTVLAVATAGSVALHDAETGAILRTMDPEPREAVLVSGLAFTNDGNALVAGAKGAPGLSWDVATGALMGRIGTEEGGRMIGVDASGNAAFHAPSGNVRSYALQDGTLVRSHDADGFIGAALTEDGATLIGHVGGSAPRLVFADPQTGTIRAIRAPEVTGVSAMAFSPDSTRLALVGPTGFGTETHDRLQIWAWQEGHVTFEAVGDSADGQAVLAWHPGGAALAVQASDVPLQLYDFEKNAGVVQGARGASPAASLVYAGNGASLIRVGTQGPVALLDAETGVVLRSWPSQYAAVSADGMDLVVGRNAPAPEVTTINLAKGEGRVTLDMPFARVGLLAYRGSEPEILGLVQEDAEQDDWTFALWGAEDGRLIRSFGKLERAPRTMTVSRDGRFVAVAEEGMPEVLLWDISADRFLWRLETGAAAVQTLAFAPDGLRIAAGLSPGSVVLWDMINGQVKARLAPFADDSMAQVDGTLFLSDPAQLDRVAVRLPDGTFLPAGQVLREGLPDFVPSNLPLPEQVAGLLDRLRAGDDDARLLLIVGRAMAFDLEFRRELQRQLKAADFYSGVIDGDIGRGSRRALELFAAAD